MKKAPIAVAAVAFLISAVAAAYYSVSAVIPPKEMRRMYVIPEKGDQVTVAVGGCGTKIHVACEAVDSFQEVADSDSGDNCTLEFKATELKYKIVIRNLGDKDAKVCVVWQFLKD